MIIELTNIDIALAGSMIAVGAGTTIFGFCYLTVTISERLPAAIKAWRDAGSETEAWKL